MSGKGRGAFLERAHLHERAGGDNLASVIVPHYRDVQSLRQSLSSLQAQHHRPLEIIVVDDGSPEAVFAEVMRCCDDVAQCIRVPHGGPAAARNCGAALAKGSILVFCESDAVYPPEYVGSIISAIAGCKDGSVVAASNVGRRVLAETKGWGHRYARVLYAAVDDAIRRGQRRTGAWAFDARWFRASGGYREDLRVGEDMELVERVIRAGLKVGYGGDVPFLHREPASIYQLFRRSYRSGAVRPRASVVALGATSVAVVVVAGLWQKAGIPPAAGALVVLAAVTLFMDPTWRLTMNFAARNGSGREMMIVSVGRLAWAAGYVCGAIFGWTKGLRASLRR